MVDIKLNTSTAMALLTTYCTLALSLATLVRSDSPVRWQRQQVEPEAMGCNQRLQSHMALQTNLTLEAIDQFMQNFTWHKFSIGWDDTGVILDESTDLDYLQVCNEASDCVRVLPEVPRPPFTAPGTESEAKSRMAEIQEYAQLYAYGLEILFLDQSLHEDTFQRHVNAIYQQFEALVGGLIFGLRQCGESPRDSSLRNLMGKVYRGAGLALRDERAFRTIRQCRLGLQYIGHFFSLEQDHPLLR